ncbi:hypothetical protein FYJ51_12230 [Erysipelotrichaceae bacterium Oil+RF-744-GAM-WT-6]|jgi:hypothetical protein|uniref:Uncharacterized protein n=1 Tax=Stecheria intestinalis TaxID=2606630 RepID=A0A7X2THJ7_9FIRM|nr:hypothetical protein [Stecheria intestinalis]MCI2153517.1 hypothetical protein [Solobacterium sp.]MCI6746953.1 hypothetical protein [Anaerolactibacter massiliensis]MDY3233132.1 hypothetical protein [Erysipelotrichaceae bacterium]MDY4682151.1 hypothetical protein [Lachnospiraceae bacterium]MDD5881765.1 hypothetical protein [Stecheria intestinalis]
MAEQQKQELSQIPYADENPLRDYLNDQNQKLFQDDDIQGEERPEEEEILPVFSNEEVRRCIEDARLSSRNTGIGVMMEICCIAPVLALGTLGDAAILLSLLLMMAFIASGIIMLISSSKRMKPYESCKKESFELEYGAEDWLKQQQTAFEQANQNTKTKGILFIVFSIAPVILGAALNEDSETLILLMCAVMMVMIGYGVSLLVRTSSLRIWFSCLLQEGHYNQEVKKDNASVSSFWGAVTAIYLIFSFATGTWAVSWLIWPIAAGVLSFLQSRKASEE